MDNLDKVIFSYLKTHTLLIMTFIVLGFLILGTGEFILYRNVMKLNQMLSEGLIQIKEGGQVAPTPTPTPKPILLKLIK